VVQCNKQLDRFFQLVECTTEDVAKFQQFLVRLMSLLYCTALQQVASVDDSQFEVLDHAGIDESSLIFLSSAKDRCEVVMHWIQKLIFENIIAL